MTHKARAPEADNPFWPEEAYENHWRGSWFGFWLRKGAGSSDMEGSRLWLIPMEEAMPENPTLFQRIAMAVDEAAHGLASMANHAMLLSEWSEHGSLSLPSEPPSRSDLALAEISDDDEAFISTVSVLCHGDEVLWNDLADWVERGLRESFPLLSPASIWTPRDFELVGHEFHQRIAMETQAAYAWREAHAIKASLAPAPTGTKAKTL